MTTAIDNAYKVLEAMENYRLNTSDEQKLMDLAILEEKCQADPVEIVDFDFTPHVLYARYGLKHKIWKLAEDVYVTVEHSRWSFDRKLESGEFVGTTYIDFDGGPFLHVGERIPGVEGKKIKEFHIFEEPDADGNLKVSPCYIITEKA